MATYYVTTAGNDTTGDGTQQNPYASLSKAITVAVDGDIIEIANGTYVEASYIILNKAITINGASKYDTVIKSANSSRIIYLNNSKLRRISNLSFENTSTISGPASLIESAGASINLQTTFSDVFFNNGRTSHILLGAGDYGIVIDKCESLVSISSTSQIISLSATAGAITVIDSIFTVTSSANVSMNGVIRQASAAVAGVLTITGNTFNIDKGVYVIRMSAGGWEEGSTISDNTFNITSATFTRQVILAANFKVAAICNDNVINILSESTSSLPIQFQSTVGTGPDCVWTCENNIIDTHNVDNYAILMGDEGGDATSKAEAFNGSSIKNNIIYTGSFHGLAKGNIHSIMVGGNINMFIEGNEVYGGTYGVVMKGDGDIWTDGYVRNNKFINCQWGVYPKGQVLTQVVGNTFVSNDGSNLKAILPGDNGVGIDATQTLIRNNLFVLDAGAAISIEEGSYDGTDSDFNVYSLTGDAVVAVVGSITYETLGEWRGMKGQDLHSMETQNPNLDEDFDIPSFSLMYKNGVPVAGVLERQIPNEVGGFANMLGTESFSIYVPKRTRVTAT